MRFFNPKIISATISNVIPSASEESLKLKITDKGSFPRIKRGVRMTQFKRTLNFFAAVYFALLSGLPFFAQAAVTPDPNCKGLLDQFTSGGGNTGTKVVEGLPQFCSAQGIIMQAINIGLTFAGGIAVLFIMVGGYWYLTSAGNEEQAEKGKKTLINSIIGLVVIIMAVVIVRIVAQTLQAK